MNPDGLNQRTEVIDLKAKVLFVQTERGTYCVYWPQKNVMFGQGCAELAQEVFNEMVINQLSEHVLNNESLDKNGSLISLNIEDTFYAVDFARRQFVSSENWEEIVKMMKEGIPGKRNEISNFETQIMNDEMKNTLGVEVKNGKKLYKVRDVYGNSYSSDNMNKAMCDLTRARDALSILKRENGTIDMTYSSIYKMDKAGPEMLNFRSVNEDDIAIKFKMDSKWEEGQRLSKKKFLGVVSNILLEVDLDCLQRHLINSKKEGLSIKRKRSSGAAYA